MKYPAHTYADTLVSLLEEYPSREEEIMQGFLKMLASSGDITHADKIISCLIERIAEKNGKDRVKIYSARALSASNQKKIEDAFGNNAHVENIILPELLAGVKIVINNTALIDATLKTKLRHLTK